MTYLEHWHQFAGESLLRLGQVQILRYCGGTWAVRRLKQVQILRHCDKTWVVKRLGQMPNLRYCGGSRIE